MMPWTPYYSMVPTASNALPLNILRANVWANSVAHAAGVAPGWSYTNSFTRGEASPGTAALPARKYFWNGTGNSKTWIKQVCTYSGSNLTKVAVYYSSNNESSYVPMLDEQNNYVLTLSYDGSSNLTATSWGNTP